MRFLIRVSTTSVSIKVWACKARLGRGRVKYRGVRIMVNILTIEL